MRLWKSGPSARLAALIRDRDCQGRNSDVIARLGRNQNIVTAIDPCRAALLLRYRYLALRSLQAQGLASDSASLTQQSAFLALPIAALLRFALIMQFLAARER